MTDGTEAVSQSPALRDPVLAILAWPTLGRSPLVKVVWTFAWLMAGSRERLIVLSVAAVADGVGLADGRPIRNALQTLVGMGALVVLDRDVAGKGKLRGRFKVVVKNPLIIATSQPPGVEYDPQATLLPGVVQPTIRGAHPAFHARENARASNEANEENEFSLTRISHHPY